MTKMEEYWYNQTSGVFEESPDLAPIPHAPWFISVIAFALGVRRVIEVFFHK